jgi:hypothetical protein
MDVGSGKAGLPAKTTLLAVLHAPTGGAFHGSSGGQFRPLRFASNGKYVLVVKTEQKGLDEAHCYNYDDSIDAVNLETEDVKELARFYDELGLDWADGPIREAAHGKSGASG